MRRCFARLREERSLGVAHFSDVKATFSEFLKRPDAKMPTVHAFQEAFNDFDLDHRRDPRAKGELLLRAEELRDELWDVCDAKLREAVAERRKIVNDTWVPDHAAIAGNHYLELAQLELDRFEGTRAVLADYYAARRGEELEEETPGAGGETASHTTPFAWCTPFLKDFSRRHSSPALPFQRLTGKTFD